MDELFNEVDAILPDDFDINNPNYSLDNEPTETVPTTEPTVETNGDAVVTPTGQEEPTTIPESAPQAVLPQTVKVKFNHEERELNLDEAAIYAQKGMNYDKLDERVKSYEAASARNERLAKQLGYKDAAEMMDAAEKNFYNRQVQQLIDAGNTEAMAKFLVDQQMKAVADNEPKPAPQTTMPTQSTPSGMTPERKAELDEFIEAFPGITKIPPEVIAANKRGVRLTQAYRDYVNANNNNNTQPQQTAQSPVKTPEQRELEKLRNENQILKQNQASAAKAPVTGVTGKPSTDIVDPLEDDPFMKGFNSEKW